MPEFVPRYKVTAIKLALLKTYRERLQETLPGAAAREGGQAAISAVLEAWRDELDKAVESLVAAAIAEIQADED